jgi:hypothetical protein
VLVSDAQAHHVVERIVVLGVESDPDGAYVRWKLDQRCSR